MRLVVVVFIFLAFLNTDLKAQNSNILDNGVCKGNMTSNGLLFYYNNQPLFSYPSNSSNNLLSLSGIWVCAQKPNDSIVASIFTESGLSDFQAGPLQQGTLIPADYNAWNTVIYVSKSEVEYHFKNHKKEDYVIPDNIKNWPTHPPQGFQGTLAPFIDWNGNKIYEPHIGEYPYIEGDQTLFTVYNDAGNRNATGGEELGIEVKQFLYSFNQTSDKKGEWQFLRIVVTNKNNFDLKNFALGFSAKIWIQNGNNNFIETYPQHNAIRGYTADTNDNQPSVSIILLNNKLTSSLYMNDAADLVTGFPTNNYEVFNMLNGRWKNGKTLTYGGNGVDGAESARYVYPAGRDPENQLFSWTEENSGNVSGIRRVLLNTEPSVLESGKSIEYRIAIMVHQTKDTSLISKELTLLNTTYQKGELTTVSKIQPAEAFNIFPNPANQTTGFTIHTPLPASTFSISDMKGRNIQLEVNEISNNKFFVKPKIPVSEGIYILKISGIHHSITKKITFLD
jgi:hypothetical protein